MIKHLGEIIDGQPEIDDPLLPGQRMMELYNQGMSDAQIAKEIRGTGKAARTVAKWRDSRGLPPNEAGQLQKPQSPPKKCEKQADAHRLDRLLDMARDIAALTEDERRFVITASKIMMEEAK